MEPTTLQALLTTSGHLVNVREISDDDVEFSATLADGYYPRVTALLYRCRNSATEAWAVRINEIGPTKCCSHNLERWFGGRVIGLGQRLSHTAARRIAEAWVTRQELPDLN